FQNAFGSFSLSLVSALYTKSTRYFSSFSGGMNSSVANAGTSWTSRRIFPRSFLGTPPPGMPRGQLQRIGNSSFGSRENFASRVYNSRLRIQCESYTHPYGRRLSYFTSMMLPTPAEGSVNVLVISFLSRADTISLS